MANRPTLKPQRPWFSSGPTAKRPGWSSQAIPQDLLGRGIRAPEVVERFAYGLRQTQALLQVPTDWVLVYVPGSDTGAVEAAMWSMLGERPVQVRTGLDVDADRRGTGPREVADVLLGLDDHQVHVERQLRDFEHQALFRLARQDSFARVTTRLPRGS